MTAFDAVLKVGGSLGRGAGLAGLGQALGQLAGRSRLLVVPGGGVFADLVREQYRIHRLGEVAAHRMALLAMDQFGCLLAEGAPGSVNTPDLDVARQVAARGGLPILLPARLLIEADPLPNSWQVTSDSLAAWIAGRVGAPRFVLLKDVDGLFQNSVHVAGDTSGDKNAVIRVHPRSSASDFRVSVDAPYQGTIENESAALRVHLRSSASDFRGRPGQTGTDRIYEELSVEALAAHRGGVDETLAAVLAGLDLETWVINGRHPERLAELLATGTTVGTRIPRSSARGRV